MDNLKTNIPNFKKNKDHTRNFFNEYAQAYRRYLQEFSPGWQPFISYHYNRFFGNLKGRLLDLGSGNTRYYEEGKYEKVILLDYALNMFETREKKANSVALNADASYIPLKNNSIDLILMNSFLHHLVKDTLKQTDSGILMCLKECRRVLKEDGRILIFDAHIPLIMEKLYKSSFFLLFNLTKALRKPMVRPLSEESLLRFIEQASLMIIKNEQIKPECRVPLAGCLLGNNRFLLSPRFYPWKFHVYFLTKK